MLNQRAAKCTWWKNLSYFLRTNTSLIHKLQLQMSYKWHIVPVACGRDKKTKTASEPPKNWGASYLDKQKQVFQEKI